MATFLDIGLLEYLLPVFSFILILVLLYAILQKTKLLGGKPGLDFTISIFIALVAMLSGKTFDFVSVSIPWFVLLIVAVVLIFLVTSVGMKGGDIFQIVNFRNILAWIALIIVIASIAFIFGPINSTKSPFFEVLFHPRILGALFIVIVISNIVKLVVKNT
jgi:hypothetical protein